MKRSCSSDPATVIRRHNRVLSDLVDEAHERARLDKKFRLSGYLRGLATVERYPEIRAALLALAQKARRS